MTLSPGMRLGPYEITASLGAGGMGEVYKATDTRLGRTVAIKILLSHLSRDAEQEQRFEREARAISNLSNPHICTLYDIGRQDGVDYLVMEYLEGETLADRLQKGPLPIDQVLQYGIQIADALAQAHRSRIIHRDLKPRNIMITKSGVKLLDFGLAKLRESGSHPAAENSELATMEHSLTKEGSVVGTLHYMAPEQLQGKDVDERADIFAFGTVLYEMVAGKRPFQGDNQASLIAAILSSEPARLSTIQRQTPALLEHAIFNCLVKDPDSRWQCAQDLSSELKWIADSKSQQAIEITKPDRRRIVERAAWTAAVALLAALLIIPSFYRSPSLRLVSFTVPAPENSTFDGSIALSPDGRYLAFVAVDATGQSLIWVRRLDSLTVQPLPGTHNAAFPFWSPDNKSLGFFAEGKLKKIALAGGSSETICEASVPRGGTWSSDGVILFSVNGGTGLNQVSDSGGSVTIVTSLNPSRKETFQRWPTFLPDGRHFLYWTHSMSPESMGIWLGSLDWKESKYLCSADSGAVYTKPGFLVYLLKGTLNAQPFDEKKLELRGAPFPVVDQPWRSHVIAGLAAYSASLDGTLVYRSGGIERTEILSFDRTGENRGPIGPPGVYFEPSLSPDEKRISLSYNDPQTAVSKIWLLELARGTITRFTIDPDFQVGSVWSPDGDEIAYSTFPEGGIYAKASSGAGKSRLVVKTGSFDIAEDWSSDGRFLVFSTIDFKTSKSDLWIQPMTSAEKPTPFLQTDYNETPAQISPDGRWIAYTSDESGRPEIYGQNFPSPGNKLQISTDGGSQPKWRRDGKELFYISLDKKVMTVQLKGNSILEPGIPQVLFQTQIAPGVEARNQYVVSADGQRFFINTPVKQIASSPIHVMINWSTALKK